MKTLRSVSLLCALLAAQSTQADSSFSQILFFGDSLTDSGSYLPALQAAVPGYAGEGKFTTNPGSIWSELLAKSYGFELSPANQGGSNYAEGGARIAESPGVGSGPALGATPIFTQVQTYLASTGGQADPNALYSLWGGANDIFWIASGAVAKADISTYLSDTITQQVTAIGALQAAGARYIIVPVLPDIGATPFGASTGAEGATALTQLSTLYNKGLMQALAQQNISVITADMFTLIREIQAQPELYGFANTTLPVCGTASSLLCIAGTTFPEGADQTYLFADGVHPTTGAHKVINQYVRSILDAPAFAQRVAVQATFEQRQVMDDIDRQLLAADSEHTALWLSGAAGRQSDDLDGNPARLGIGFITPEGFGAAFHIGRNDSDVEGGTIDTTEHSFSLYNRWQGAHWGLNTSLSVSSGTYDTRRLVQLGAATRQMKASTDGLQLGLQARWRYRFIASSLRHGPVLGLSYQRLRLDGFSESSTAGTAAAMQFSSQNIGTTTASVGWEIRSTQGSWQPFASLVWEKRLSGAPDSSAAALVNLPDNTFTLPAATTDDSYGIATLGITGQVNDNLRLNARVNHLFGHDSLDDTRFNLSAHFLF